MCLYPKLIRNRKYTKNKKNGGNIPPLPLIEINGRMIDDTRVLEVPVKCGKCIECRKQEARKWQIRLLEEVRDDKTGIFVTLTFSNESIKELGTREERPVYKKGINKGKPKKLNKYENIWKLNGYEKDNAIAGLAVRRFLERWRKEHKKSAKHWLITELGHQGTENIHLHGIIWTEKKAQDIRKHWKYGYVWLSSEHNGWVNEQTVNYIVKYVNKQDEIHTEYKPIILTSAGIGKGYLKRIDATNNKYNKEKTNETYRNRQGYKMSLPIYYRNKIYTEEEREKLWQEKLDKQERWVLGQKIDISKGEEEYNKAVEYARKINKELRYGDDKINWDKRRYENERRNINFIQRLKNSHGGD